MGPASASKSDKFVLKHGQKQKYSGPTSLAYVACMAQGLKTSTKHVTDLQSFDVHLDLMSALATI
jgi:hypothetical protein